MTYLRGTPLDTLQTIVKVARAFGQHLQLGQKDLQWILTWFSANGIKTPAGAMTLVAASASTSSSYTEQKQLQTAKAGADSDLWKMFMTYLRGTPLDTLQTIVKVARAFGQHLQLGQKDLQWILTWAILPHQRLGCSLLADLASKRFLLSQKELSSYTSFAATFPGGKNGIHALLMQTGSVAFFEFLVTLDGFDAKDGRLAADALSNGQIELFDAIVKVQGAGLVSQQSVSIPYPSMSTARFLEALGRIVQYKLYVSTGQQHLLEMLKHDLNNDVRDSKVFKAFLELNPMMATYLGLEEGPADPFQLAGVSTSVSDSKTQQLEPMQG